MFNKVHGRECILVPGKFVVKECLEELGVLSDYMSKYHQWIGREFSKRFVLSLNILSLSLQRLQARFLFEGSHTCGGCYED